MFTKNTYLIPQVSPSLHINDVEILLHHHHHHPDMFPTHHNAPLLADPSSSMPNAPLPRKQAVKKDRHSKINTAQGPRDRRVRLSIGIARKFFDLQEILGFDKPSKTLDWLLTKSKEAITDLVHSKKKATDNTTDKSSSECELLSSTGNYEASENGADSKSKFGGKDPPQLAASNLAKESRAKARAKARARTREKMCIKQQLNGNRSNDLNVVQNRNNINQLSNVGYPSLPAPTDEDLIHESVSMIKLKSKNPSFNIGFHQNAIVSSPNYVVPSSSQNWDVCSFTSQSNNYTILDQHKFINRNSNI